jgi:DNA-binding protein HU-beta
MASSSKMTKAQIIASLSESSGLDKKSVNAVFDALYELIKRELSAEGPGEIVLPGLVKLRAKETPATQDRQGTNPFTKEPMVIKGKPASRKLRATPIKALKDLVGA